MESFGFYSPLIIQKVTKEVNDAETSRSAILKEDIKDRMVSIQQDVKRAREDFENRKDLFETKGVDVSQVETEIVHLQDRIATLIGRLPSRFDTQSHIPENIVEKTVNAVKDWVVKQVQGYIFPITIRSKKNRALPKQKEQLKAEVNQLHEEEKVIKQHIRELVIEKGKLSKEMMAKPDQKTLKAKIHDIDKAYKKEHLQLKKIQLKLINKGQALEKIHQSLTEVASLEEKGNEMRRNLQILGGERIALKTPDGIQLDSMYLDARKFRTSLNEAGCELTTLQLKGERSLQVIRMSKENYDKNGQNVINALKQLKSLTDTPKNEEMQEDVGSGWTLVRDGEDYLLVNADDMPKRTGIPSSPFYINNGVWRLKKTSKLNLSPPIKMNISEEGVGTVIISSGNLGVYEMHKSEAMYFLFNNFNVVLFNPRGYGKSQGEPSEKGLNLDMESAYQLAKSKSRHEDHQICIKAKCMTGGPAALLAARHPQMNLILDQSYAEFKTLIAEVAKSKAGELMRSYLVHKNNPSLQNAVAELLVNAVETLAYGLAHLVPIDFTTAESLARNQGYKALFFVHDDALINTHHMERNVQAIASAGKMEYLTVFSAPGKHAASLLGSKGSVLNYHSEFNALMKQYREVKRELEKSDTKETHLQKIAEIKKQMELICVQLGINENIDLIISSFETEPYNFSMVGRNQLSQFLKKAHLYGPILKSEAEMQRSSLSPLERDKQALDLFTDSIERIYQLVHIHQGMPKKLHLGTASIELEFETPDGFIKKEISHEQLELVATFQERIHDLTQQASEYLKNKIITEEQHQATVEALKRFPTFTKCISEGVENYVFQKIENFNQSFVRYQAALRESDPNFVIIQKNKLESEQFQLERLLQASFLVKAQKQAIADVLKKKIEN